MRRNSTRPITPAVMNTDETALYLSISRSHLYRLVQEKRIPYLRLSGNTLSFRTADLDDWLEAKVIRPTAARRAS